MKRTLILLAIIVTLPFGCKVVKHKKLNNTVKSVKFSRNIKTSRAKIDSLRLAVATIEEDVSNVDEEEVSVKRGNRLENIVLSANFKLDTSVVDTLKIVDINNNGITLSIFQKGNEVMATVTTPKSSHTAPFDEIRIRNKKSTKTEKTDDIATFENHSKIIESNLDSSIMKRKETSIVKEKEKKTGPDFWVWIGVSLVVCFFLWLGFRRK